MPTPVIVVDAGGVPIVNTPLGAPMTPVGEDVGGMPVTIVDDDPPNRCIPVHLVNDDLTDWEP